VFNKQLSLAVQASQQKCQANQWGAMLISTATFAKAIFTVTGKDIGVFVDTWVRQCGHARFQLSFVFNRKRYRRRRSKIVPSFDPIIITFIT